MKQETWIQIFTLIILVILAIFYDPRSADFEGRIIFFAITISIVLFFIFMDLYKLVNENKTRIRLFDEKWKLSERIKNLEDNNKI